MPGASCLHPKRHTLMNTLLPMLLLTDSLTGTLAQHAYLLGGASFFRFGYANLQQSGQALDQFTPASSIGNDLVYVGLGSTTTAWAGPRLEDHPQRHDLRGRRRDLAAHTGDFNYYQWEITDIGYNKPDLYKKPIF